MSSVRLLVSALVVLSCCCSVAAHGAVSAGYPYIDVSVQPIDPADQENFNQDYFKTQIGVWLKGNVATYFGTALVVPSGIHFEDYVNTSGVLTWKVTIDPAVYGDGVVHFGLTAINTGAPSPLSDIFTTQNYTVNTLSLVNNYAASVQMSLSPSTFRQEYNSTWSETLYLNLNHAPQPGNKVVVKVTNVGLTSDPVLIEIAYPLQQKSFKLFAATGTYTLDLVIDGTTTVPARYVLPTGSPSITFLASQVVNVVAPASTIRFYNDSRTADFKISVPSSYRDASFNLKVTVRSSPAGLSVYQNDNYLTTRGTEYSFYCIGPTGTFELRYEIATPSGTTSQDNANFAPITVVHTLVLEAKLNISSGNIPNGYLVNAPTSVDYGGAYSLPINVHIERPPKVGLLLYITAPGVEISTPIFAFTPTGPTVATYTLRSLSAGLKQVSFSIGGASADDYAVPESKPWLVLNSNPDCIKRTTLSSCFATSGCQYYTDRGYCSNRSMPIVIFPLPVLYHEETSVELTLTLPTAVQNALTIQFVAPSTLLFDPPRFDLVTGAKVLTFTVTGTLLRPTDGSVSESFYLRLSDSDANYFRQNEFQILTVPRTVCELTAPYAFFVGTESPTFTLVCDKPPEDQIILTPIQLDGVEYIFETINGATLLNSNTSTPTVVFSNATTTITFRLKSVDGVIGRHTMSWNISGVNAPRFDAIEPYVINILPHAEVNPLPYFRLAAYMESPFDYHLDLTYIPQSEFNVTIRAVHAENGTFTDTVQFLPSNTFNFNNTNRQFVKVFATEPGLYKAVYILGGEEAEYFITPVNSTFEIKDPVEGNAFTYRQQLGYQPKTSCRVNVGMNSQWFTGQDSVATEKVMCNNIIDLPANVSNGTTVCPVQPNEVRCKYITATTGELCVWHNDACEYLPQLQGNIKDLSYGSGFTVMVAKNGSVYSIGRASYGQLGHTSDSLAQVVLPDNENASSVVAGTSFTLVLSDSSKLYSWGANYRGQLGVGRIVFSEIEPQEVPLPKFTTVTCISAGSEHAGALTDTGTLYMWGSNQFGQTGNIATFRGFHRQTITVSRDGFGGEAVTHFQCGTYHTMVATETAAYTFGNNNRGQLGRPGFDEWEPAQTVIYQHSDFVDAPTYPSYLLGTTQCPTEET